MIMSILLPSLLSLFLKLTGLSQPANALIASIPFSPVEYQSSFSTNLKLNHHQSRVHQSYIKNTFKHDTNDSNDDVYRQEEGEKVVDPKRRQMFGDVLRVATCGCTLAGCYSPHTAYALANIISPDQEAKTLYDVSRNNLMDAAFAQGMATGMVDYEREAFPRKKKLFSTLFASLETIKEDPIIVEVGMGSFPNALYYQKVRKGLDIIGIDPNDKMEAYARDSATRAGIVSQDSLRIIHGVSEALPLPDASVDAVVCTLTLCSVVNPSKSIAEIKRVLKPGGKFLFWEHVLSENDESLMQAQIKMSPQQVKRADGCHLDRRTGKAIEAAGFAKIDMEYLDLKNFYFLNPTVCGIATA